MDESGLLTDQDVARRLKCSPRFVRRLVSERRIAFVKVGRSTRFEPADVEAYIAANRVVPLSRAQHRAELWRAA